MPNPYPVKACLNNTEYYLPKGFTTSATHSFTQAGEVKVYDFAGDECDFRIIGGQPCLISMRGAWDIFPDRAAVQTIGGPMPSVPQG